MRRLLTAACLAAIASLALSTGSATADVRPFAVKSATPTDGATLPQTSTITFQVKTDDPVTFGRIEVATQPTLGQDGTLAAEFTVPWGLIVSTTRGDAFPDTYTGTAFPYALPSTGGTYYWQMSYTKSETLSGPPYVQTSTYTSPVYRFVIAATTPPAATPTPPPSTTPTTPTPTPLYLTLGQATADVKIAIKDHTGLSARSLKRTCKRRSDATFSCEVAWSTTTRMRPSTVIYAGTLTLSDLGDDYFSYSFKGLRAKGSCIAHRGVKACTRSVTWR